MKTPVLLFGLLLGAASVFAAEQSSAPKSPPPAPPPAAEEEKPAGSKTEQLAAAQKQLGILKLRYDEKHPAILKQRAKVARLQKEVRDEEKQKGPRTPAEELATAKEELAELRQKFTDQHPMVIALQRRVSELEKRQ